MNALCLSIDRLHCGFLGLYGNAWIGTQQFDRLASESYVFDQCLADSIALDTLFESLWQAAHAWMPVVPPACGSLPRRLAAEGYHTVLLTDEPQLVAHRLVQEFSELIQVQQPQPDVPAADPSQTQLVRLFAQVGDVLRTLRQPYFLWVHSRGMAGAWDAPMALREAFVAEGDPSPPDWVTPPQLTLPENSDPDVLLGIRQAYAGQVAVLDACLGGLLEDLAAAPGGEQTVMSLMALRGLALGEHGWVGLDAPLLHDPLVHLAWLLRFPDGLGSADRSGRLVQPGDLAPTLLEALQVPPDPLAGWGRSLLPMVRREDTAYRDQAACRDTADQWRGFRTPAWSMLWQPGDPEARPRLYAKPDDRWQLNDVADRVLEIPEAMRQAAEAFQRACAAQPPVDPPPLDERLLRLPE